jgi:hypothetical protein
MLQVVAGCDLDPVAQGTLASPAAVPRLKVLFIKAAYIIAVNVLGFVPKFQRIFMLICTFLIWWLNFTNIPFYTRAHCLVDLLLMPLCHHCAAPSDVPSYHRACLT